MKQFRDLLLAGTIAMILVFKLASVASGQSPRIDSVVTWIPLHVPLVNEVFKAKLDGTYTWATWYAKQYNQTQFQLCGSFLGHGQALLSYADSGDPYQIDTDVKEALCINDTVGFGGGAYPNELSVHLNGTLEVFNPNIFVGQ